MMQKNESRGFRSVFNSLQCFKLYFRVENIVLEHDQKQPILNHYTIVN